MERRNRSVRALKELIFIDSQEAPQRAEGLSRWTKEYLTDNTIEDFDLELTQLKQLEELFYKNISFLKNYKNEIKEQLDSHRKIKEFLH